MERIELELFKLDHPAFADELVGREGLEPSSEVAGADEVGEVAFERLVVGVER